MKQRKTYQTSRSLVKETHMCITFYSFLRSSIKTKIKKILKKFRKAYVRLKNILKYGIL